MTQPKEINAAGLLYHFLQRELWEEDVWLFQSLASRLILRLGIWISPDAYAVLPWLAPYARRDPTCRGNKRRGEPDAWGSPDADGFLRDDNSLLKGVPRSMKVRSTLRAYAGKRLGSGFVAAHVWREIDGDVLAARDPLTYSFIPNLVWLPSDVAKLTDREGSFAQQFVQALATKIYRQVTVSESQRTMVESVWSRLPEAIAVPSQALPDVHSLNFFEPSSTFFRRRSESLHLVASALRAGGAPGKVIASRYAPGLAEVNESARQALASRLEMLRASLVDGTATGVAHEL